MLMTYCAHSRFLSVNFFYLLFILLMKKQDDYNIRSIFTHNYYFYRMTLNYKTNNKRGRAKRPTDQTPYSYSVLVITYLFVL